MRKFIQQLVYRLGFRPKRGYLHSHWLDWYYQMQPWQREIASSFYGKARNSKAEARKQVARALKSAKKAGKKNFMAWVDDKPATKAARLFEKRLKKSKYGKGYVQRKKS